MKLRMEEAAGVRRSGVSCRLTAGVHLRATALAEVGAQVAVRPFGAAARELVVRAAQTAETV